MWFLVGARLGPNPLWMVQHTQERMKKAFHFF